MVVKIDKKEVDVKILAVNAYIRDWDVCDIYLEPNDSEFPCLVKDEWQPLIEIETGKILNWQVGVKANINLRLRDNCSYKLIDINNNAIISRNDDYVPYTLNNGNDSDQLTMEINEEGMIKDWDFDIYDFTGED